MTIRVGCFMLSIVTINRNNEAGLSKTIESLSLQTSQNFQWVLIDGASNDGSVGLGEAFIRPGDILVSEPDLGIYNAMNKGVIKSDGNYVLFLNSGDVFAGSNSVQSILDELSNSDDLILFGFSVRDKVRMPKPLWSRFWSLPTSHQAIVYRRSLLKQYSYLESFRFAADFEHFLRIMTKSWRIRSIKHLLVVNEPYGSDNNLERVLSEYRSALLLNGYPKWLASLIYHFKRFYLGLVL